MSTLKATILDRAMDLFLTKGYEQTSVTDIIASVEGLSRGGFYHHFSSKEAILVEIPGHFKRGDLDYAQLIDNQDLTGLEKIKQLLLHNFSRAIDNQEELKLVALLNDPRFLSIKIKYLSDSVFDFYEALIIEGVADGSLVIAQPKMVAQMSAVLLNIWCQPTVFNCSTGELTQRFEFLKEQLAQLGLPIFDGEVWAACQGYIHQFS